MAGADVEEAKLVRARRVIGARGLDRIAGVAQVDEIDALDDAPVGDVEAGDDADADGHRANPGNPFVSSEVETPRGAAQRRGRSEEHTSEIQSLMRISYAVFCLEKKKNHT